MVRRPVPGAPLIRVAPSVPERVDAIVVPVASGRGVSGRAISVSGPVELDERFLEGRGFDGRPGETQVLLADDGSAIVAVGVGDAHTLTTDGLRRAAAAGVRACGRARRVALCLLDAGLLERGSGGAGAAGIDVAAAAQACAEGAVLGAYAFVAHKSVQPPATLGEVVLVSSDPRAIAGAERGVVVASATRLARDLVNEPAGTLTPSRLAEVAVAEAGRVGLGVTVVDAQAAATAGLGGLLGVARGSHEPPCLIELLYEPPASRGQTPTVAFVGKGITFDSGGLSLKTASGMTSMKTDMSGAAAVIGAMSAIAVLGAPVRVLGLCPVTENMPGGSAIKPGDVLRMRNDRTVEVLNTDAEGRLVLADALCLAVEAGVDAVVDLATLTGAVVTSLGRSIAGLMGSDEGWLGEVRAAAGRAGEAVWALPLPEEYRRDIDSDIADIRNTAGTNPAGTLTAGLFLREFTGGLPWAHLDIAGTARSESDDGYVSKGGTGWGVRTLVELATSGVVTAREGAVRRPRWAGHTPAARLVPKPGKAAAPKAAAGKAAAGKAAAPKTAAGKPPGRAAAARKGR